MNNPEEKPKFGIYANFDMKLPIKSRILIALGKKVKVETRINLDSPANPIDSTSYVMVDKLWITKQLNKLFKKNAGNTTPENERT